MSESNPEIKGRPDPGELRPKDRSQTVKQIGKTAIGGATKGKK